MQIIKKLFVINGRLRAGWRIVVFFLLCIPVLLFASVPHIIALPKRLLELAFYLILFWGILIVSFLLAFLLDKRHISTIGYMFHSRWLKEYLLGVLIGFVLISIIFFFELTMGYIEVEKFNVINRPLIINIFIYWIIYFIFQSAFEELTFRGYLFQNFIEGANALIAIAVLSTLFGAAHLFNPNSSWVAALNITAVGVLMSLAYLQTKSLWLPSGIHFSWNFFLGNIFSLPVSGIKRTDSLLTIKQQGPTWITGGNFGPEAGVPALILVIAACFLIFYWKRIKTAPKMEKLWENYKRKYEIK